MKVYETGTLPVHIVLSKLSAEEDFELERSTKHEIAYCYKEYTPAQCITHDPIQVEYELTLMWKMYIKNILFKAQFTPDIWDIYADILNANIEVYLEDYVDLGVAFPDYSKEMAHTNTMDFMDAMDFMDNMNDEFRIGISTESIRHSIRRTKTALHRQRDLKNLIHFYMGYNSRCNMDFYYSAVINRRMIENPKSRSYRFDKMLRNAVKRELITIDELFRY